MPQEELPSQFDQEEGRRAAGFIHEVPKELRDDKGSGESRPMHTEEKPAKDIFFTHPRKDEVIERYSSEDGDMGVVGNNVNPAGAKGGVHELAAYGEEVVEAAEQSEQEPGDTQAH